MWPSGRVSSIWVSEQSVSRPKCWSCGGGRNLPSPIDNAHRLYSSLSLPTSRANRTESAAWSVLICTSVNSSWMTPKLLEALAVKISHVVHAQVGHVFCRNAAWITGYLCSVHWQYAVNRTPKIFSVSWLYWHLLTRMMSYSRSKIAYKHRKDDVFRSLVQRFDDVTSPGFNRQ